MNILRPLMLVTLMLTAANAWAEGLDWQKLYFGGGLGSAEVPQSGDTATALQLMVGYPLEMPSALASPQNNLSLEVGYMDVSDYPYSRFWGTAVLRRYLNSEVDLLLRFGLEAGNNEGFFTPIAALGAEHKLDRLSSVRLEFIERADSPALMINLIYRP